jgi:mannose-binding lectin 1
MVWYVYYYNIMRDNATVQVLWYTAQKGQLGPVFGSNDYWTGMGLFFDSFDNDNQVSAHNELFAL